MMMDRTFIDILSAGFEIYLTALFFGVLWEMKTTSRTKFLSGVLLLFVIYLAIIFFFRDSLLFPLIVFTIKIALSFFYKSSIQSKLLFSAISVTVLALAEILTGLTISQLTGVDVKEMQSNILTYFVGVFVSKLLVLTAIKAIQYFRKDKKQISSKHALAMLFSPMYSLILAVIIYIIAFDSKDEYIIMLCQISTIILVFANIFVFYIMESIKNAELIKQKHIYFKNQLQKQIAHYQELYESQDEIRKMRHDMRANLIAINAYLSDNQVGQAILHIDKVTEDLSADKVFAETNNPILDAIIDAQIKKARRNQTKIDYRISLIKDILINPMDLAIVIVNALDNAIEYMNQIGDTETEILLRLSQSNSGDYLSISVENPMEEILDTGAIKTSKIDKKNHGFGLKQIDNIAQKYDGNMTLRADSITKKFYIHILLKNEEISEIS